MDFCPVGTCAGVVLLKMHSEIHFWILKIILFIWLLCTVWFFFPKTRCSNCCIVGRIPLKPFFEVFFEVFTPYFSPILIRTLKWVDFYEKIDFFSKFEYIISKIGESPPKSVSSFPNRDPLCGWEWKLGCAIKDL